MRGQSLVECAVIWAATLLLAFSITKPLVNHISHHTKQVAERIH